MIVFRWYLTTKTLKRVLGRIVIECFTGCRNGWLHQVEAAMDTCKRAWKGGMQLAALCVYCASSCQAAPNLAKSNSPGRLVSCGKFEQNCGFESSQQCSSKANRHWPFQLGQQLPEFQIHSTTGLPCQLFVIRQSSFWHCQQEQHDRGSEERWDMLVMS